MTVKKDDCPPLLKGGLHYWTIKQLKERAVLPFAKSINRWPLFDLLEVYLEALTKTGLLVEILVCGSFLTEKLDPDDLDILVIFGIDQMDQLPIENQEKARILLDTQTIFLHFHIHVHSVDRSEDDEVNSRLNFFGTQHDNVTPQGLVSLRLKP